MKVIEIIHLKTKNSIKSVGMEYFYSNFYLYLNRGDYIHLDDVTYEIAERVLVDEQTLIIGVNDIQ